MYTAISVKAIFIFGAVMLYQLPEVSPRQIKNLVGEKVELSTSEAPYTCPGSGNYPVPGQECTGVYYSCSTGTPIIRNCPGASVFEPSTQACTSASTAPCKKPTVPSTTVETSTSIVTTATSTLSESTTSASTSTAYTTTTTRSTVTPSTVSTTTRSTVTPATVSTTTRSTTILSTGTSSPLPFTCLAPNGIYPNPNNCRTFYICSNENGYLYECPSNLVFNPDKGYCDYPENVPSCTGKRDK